MCPWSYDNIISVFGEGEIADSGMFYFDGNLEQYMERWRRNVKDVIMMQTSNIMAQVAHGVAFIHMHKKVHRDLKP